MRGSGRGGGGEEEEGPSASIELNLGSLISRRIFQDFSGFFRIFQDFSGFFGIFRDFSGLRATRILCVTFHVDSMGFLWTHFRIFFRILFFRIIQDHSPDPAV